MYLDEIDETLGYVNEVKDHLPCFAFTNSNPTHQDFWLIRLDAMLFFDDTKENVVGAEMAGMCAVFVRDHADVKQALVEIGAL